MDFEALSMVEFGDTDGLRRFLFENGMQHQLFFDTLSAQGISTDLTPILDANPDNLDDWLYLHNDVHESLASALNLDNPFNLIDSDWQVEADFYDWLGVHLNIHQQIARTLGLT